MENAKLAENVGISVMLSVAEKTKSRNWKSCSKLHKFEVITRVLQETGRPVGSSNSYVQVAQANSLGKRSNSGSDSEIPRLDRVGFGLAERKGSDRGGVLYPRASIKTKYRQRDAVHRNATKEIARVGFWNRARTVARTEIGPF